MKSLIEGVHDLNHEIKRHDGEHLWPRIRRGRQKPRIEHLKSVS